MPELSVKMWNVMKSLYGEKITQSRSLINWALEAETQALYDERCAKLVNDYGFKNHNYEINFDEPLMEKYRINELYLDDQIQLYLSALEKGQEKELEQFWKVDFSTNRLAPLFNKFINETKLTAKKIYQLLVKIVNSIEDIKMQSQYRGCFLLQ